jgi:hypothetical protein
LSEKTTATVVYTLNNGIRRFVRRNAQIDQEWSDLHAWLLQFRVEHKLSAKEFLRAVDMNPDKNYLIQLTCRGGRKRFPSKKEFSLGKEFRDKVLAFKYAQEKTPENWDNVEKDDFNEMVRTWKYDNNDNLEHVGIRDVTVSGSGEIVLHHVESCTVSDEDFAAIVLESFQPFPLNGRNIRRQRTQLLSTSVLALSGGEDKVCGTGTALNVKGFCLCLTCKHVVPVL